MPKSILVITALVRDPSEVSDTINDIATILNKSPSESYTVISGSHDGMNNFNVRFDLDSIPDNNSMLIIYKLFMSLEAPLNLNVYEEVSDGVIEMVDYPYVLDYIYWESVDAGEIDHEYSEYEWVFPDIEVLKKMDAVRGKVPRNQYVTDAINEYNKMNSTIAQLNNSLKNLDDSTVEKFNSYTGAFLGLTINQTPKVVESNLEALSPHVCIEVTLPINDKPTFSTGYTQLFLHAIESICYGCVPQHLRQHPDEMDDDTFLMLQDWCATNNKLGMSGIHTIEYAISCMVLLDNYTRKKVDVHGC